jgi:hypothetical protein
MKNAITATELMKLRDPNLNARYYPGTNKGEYLKELCATPGLIG